MELLSSTFLELPNPIRIIMLLYYYDEISVPEIADIFETKESNVVSCLIKGDKMLKNMSGHLKSLEKEDIYKAISAAIEEYPIPESSLCRIGTELANLCGY